MKNIQIWTVSTISADYAEFDYLLQECVDCEIIVSKFLDILVLVLHAVFLQM